MGLMKCSRRGCNEILCHKKVLGVYICTDCIRELEEWKAEDWPKMMTSVEVASRIDRFLGTEKGSLKMLDGEEIDAEFKRLIQDS